MLDATTSRRRVELLKSLAVLVQMVLAGGLAVLLLEAAPTLSSNSSMVGLWSFCAHARRRAEHPIEGTPGKLP